jgi:hypothetical protein
VARLRSDRVATLETALVAVGFVVMFFCLPHELAEDDRRRFDDIERLLHDGELSDGRYSLVMPLVSAPFLLVGWLAGPSEEWWAERFNVLVVAAGAVAGFRLLRGRGDRALLRKVLLVLLASSFLTNRLRDYNAEILTATLAVLGILCLTTSRRVLGWGAVILGVVNTPAALGGLGLVAAAQVLRTRRLRWLVPVAVAVVLVGAESWLRRGSPTDSGYAGDHGFETLLPYSGRPGFSYPFVLGVLSILFSFGRGLAFFTPGLVLGAFPRTWRLLRGRTLFALALLLFLAGLVLVYARWWAWYGGSAWGPRFFVFAAVPAALFLAVRLHRPPRSPAENALTLAVLVLSGWVGVTGAVADLSALEFCARDTFALESFCWYVPEYSSLWQPVLGFPSLSASTAVVVAFCALVFVYLATPLVVGIVRGVRRRVAHADLLGGWRI